MRNLILVFAVIIVTITTLACSNSNSAPCDWEESTFYAKIEKVEYKELNQNGDSVYTVWASFNAGSLHGELHDLGALKGIEYTNKNLGKFRIKIGHKFKGVINDLKSGNCKSPIISFE